MTRLSGHTGVWSGKRVKVFVEDGNHFIAKFKEKKGRRIHFFDHDSIAVRQVRTLTIWKGKEPHV